jgi:hypothetical protein
MFHLYQCSSANSRVLCPSPFAGHGKITPERIARLEGMGFEWDPQRAQWNHMFEKLKQFKEEVGHCKVPKVRFIRRPNPCSLVPVNPELVLLFLPTVLQGYTKDPELANWVRNQRLEHANMIKGKKSRMTEDRFKKLDEAGFKWSTTTPTKGSTPKEIKEESPKDADAIAKTGGEDAEAKEGESKDAEVVKKEEEAPPKEEEADGVSVKEEATNGDAVPESLAVDTQETVEV